jgi:hypothetical protein
LADDGIAVSLSPQAFLAKRVSLFELPVILLPELSLIESPNVRVEQSLQHNEETGMNFHNDFLLRLRIHDCLVHGNVSDALNLINMIVLHKLYPL